MRSGLGGHAAALGRGCCHLVGNTGHLVSTHPCPLEHGSSKGDLPAPSCMLEVHILGPPLLTCHVSLGDGTRGPSFRQASPGLLCSFNLGEATFSGHRTQPGSPEEVGQEGQGPCRKMGEACRTVFCSESRQVSSCVPDLPASSKLHLPLPQPPPPHRSHTPPPNSLVVRDPGNSKENPIKQ